MRAGASAHLMDFERQRAAGRVATLQRGRPPLVGEQEVGAVQPEDLRRGRLPPGGIGEELLEPACVARTPLLKRLDALVDLRQEQVVGERQPEVREVARERAFEQLARASVVAALAAHDGEQSRGRRVPGLERFGAREVALGVVPAHTGVAPPDRARLRPFPARLSGLRSAASAPARRPSASARERTCA